MHACHGQSNATSSQDPALTEPSQGFEAARKIREYERCLGLPRTPIIALSASRPYGDTEQIPEALMDDFASKPIRLMALQDQVLFYGRLGRNAGRGDLPRFLASVSCRPGAPGSGVVAKL